MGNSFSALLLLLLSSPIPLTGESNEFKSSQGKHRLERDRRLALSEYAPGQDIVVDDRVYRSVGVLRPSDLEQQYYWVCKSCNHFQHYVDPNMTVEECPTCQQRPIKTVDQKVYPYRVPIPWLTLLTDAVNSIRSSEIPLQLIVHQLPKPDSDAHRFLRKRLAQWVEEGLIELYQTPLEQLPILAISTYQGSAIALSLSATNSSYEWLQTRHSEGVQEVKQRLNQIKMQQVLVTDLEDTDTTLVSPNLSWKNLTLTELRQKLGLEACLSGGEITKLVYRDRFFYESGAKLFAKLLQSENITANTQIVIDTRENSCNVSERKRELETALTPLCSGGSGLKITVHPNRTSRLEHGRILEIQRADGDCYRIVFDKGIDFIKETSTCFYQIQEPTYIVIHRFQSR